MTNFKRIDIENFGGIDPTSPVTIVFPDDKRITILEGDQGTNKTSTLTAIEALMGGIYPEYYINKNTKSIGGIMEFEHDGKRYRTRITKTQFKLEQFIDVAGKEKWSSTGEDKTLIRKLLPYATSPDVLQQKDGTEQIEWLKKIAGSNADDTSLVALRKEKYSKRTVLNREVEIYRNQLIESGNFVKEGKDIIPTEEFQALSDKATSLDATVVESKAKEDLDNARRNLSKIASAKAKLDELSSGIKQKLDKIEELRLAIAQLETEVDGMKEQKAKGEQFITDNETKFREEVTKAETDYDEARNLKNTIESIKSTNATYEAYKKVFDNAVNISSEIEDIDMERLRLAKSFTPDIEGFEVRLGGNIDEEKGLFLNGVNIATLSESERYALCIKIWEHYKVKVVFIENISSLGSNAIDVVKMFISNGGTVFATQMRRNQQTISVSFNL